MRVFAFVVTGVLRGLRYLDSQPTPRSDHVEACRPRGFCSPYCSPPCACSMSWWSARGRRARWRRGGSPSMGWTSRSSRTGWSAASARSGPACRRRRCCGPTRRSRRRAGTPGVPVGDDLDVAAVLARRDEVIHDLDDDAQLPWLESRGIALVRGHGRLTGERRVTVGDEELEARRAVILVHRLAADDAADRGPGRDRRPVDQPRGDDGQGPPGAAADHRRRRGRRRDGAGVPDARQPGHADRGRAAAAAARRGVRVRAGDRGADRATASTSAAGRRPNASSRPTTAP